MKITVLMGSPNRNGSTSILVDNFAKGAGEAGHGVEIIDVCHANIHPCTGCVRCGYEGPCVLKDDVEKIRRQLITWGKACNNKLYRDCSNSQSRRAEILYA